MRIKNVNMNRQKLRNKIINVNGQKVLVKNYYNPYNTSQYFIKKEEDITHIYNEWQQGCVYSFPCGGSLKNKVRIFCAFVKQYAYKRKILKFIKKSKIST